MPAKTLKKLIQNLFEAKTMSLFDRKEEWIFTENESEIKQEDLESKGKQTCWSNEKTNFAESESLIGLLWGIYLVDKLYSD